MDKGMMASYVRTILAEKAQDIYLRNYEFEYYGWVSKKVPKELEQVPNVDRGHWLGAAQEVEARQLVRDAEYRYKTARANAAGLRFDSPGYSEAQADKTLAMNHLEAARKHLDEVMDKIQQATEKRRQFRIDKLITKMFRKYYHRARHEPWPLYDARLPANLREYLMIQLRNEKLSPTAMVFLWIVVEENLDHGGVFQVKGLGNTDYLAKHALATSPYDIDASEDRPTRVETDYMRELQRPEESPAHENLDPRTNRLEHAYDGLPQLGGLAERDHDERSCPTCGNFMRDRVLLLRGKYYLAEACDNYATTCRFEMLSDGFATRKQVNEHREIHAELRTG